MTHNDIYTKFMIEYDKAAVTSSYPSLTEYEVATILDKAYNALIAQKVSGNNYRRVPFEADVKAISDLQPLIVEKPYDDIQIYNQGTNNPIPNVITLNNPEDFLYAVGCYLSVRILTVPLDIDSTIELPKGGVSWEIGDLSDTVFLDIRNGYFIFDDYGSYTIDGGKLQYNSNNSPAYWKVGALKKFKIEEAGKDPVILIMLSDVCVVDDIDAVFNYIQQHRSLTVLFYPNSSEQSIDISQDTVTFTPAVRENSSPLDQKIHKRTVPCQLVDFKTAERFFTSVYNMPWIKIPVYYIHGNTFNIVYDILSDYYINKCSLKYIKSPEPFVRDLPSTPTEDVSFFSTVGDDAPGNLQFELNDTMAEELISLAIAFALENIESPRLNTKLNMRGLEA